MNNIMNVLARRKALMLELMELEEQLSVFIIK